MNMMYFKYVYFNYLYFKYYTTLYERQETGVFVVNILLVNFIRVS